MQEEIAQEVQYLEVQADALRNYAVELALKGHLPFFATASKPLRRRADEFVKQLDNEASNVFRLVRRHEYLNGETPAGAGIEAIGSEVAGVAGGLSATVEIAKGRLRHPDGSASKKRAADVAIDFMKASEVMARLAARLQELSIE